MSDFTDDLTDTQQFWLGIARADQDLEEQTAAIRIAQDREQEPISSHEAADKLVMVREHHYAEILRLRDRFLNKR